jgi:UDP-3-O-acyl-N-acetylglucosamine deacetylase
MANIIITESQEALLLNTLLNDNTPETTIKVTTDEFPIEDLSDKILSVKKYLDKYFKKGNIDQIKDGKPAKLEVALMMSDNGKILKTLTDKQLFDQVQTDFKNILPEKDRDKFLKDVITKWFYNKINDSGTFAV